MLAVAFFPDHASQAGSIKRAMFFFSVLVTGVYLWILKSY